MADHHTACDDGFVFRDQQDVVVLEHGLIVVLQQWP